MKVSQTKDEAIRNPTEDSAGLPCKAERSIAMDGSLWCALPEDLLDQVLARLPLISLFRARGVCKRWRLLVFSRSFLEICAEVPSREKYFLVFPVLGDKIVCSAFNTSTRKWHGIPSLSFLPSQVKYVEGGDGGLLFFSFNVQVEPVTLFVCNPITKQWRELPPMIHRRTPLVRHMVVDRKSNSYKIIVAGNAKLANSVQNDHHFLSTEVYDSSTNSWLITGNVPATVDLNWSSAYDNGLLYCVANDLISMKLVVITYDLQGGFWGDVLEELPDDYSFVQVVESQGRILTIAEQHKKDIVKSIHVLEFNLTSRQWTEMSRLPRGLLVQFRKICEEESFNCVEQDDKIFLTSFRGMRVLVFDIKERTWSWLSSCPSFQHKDCRAVGFSFEPSLHRHP